MCRCCPAPPPGGVSPSLSRRGLIALVGGLAVGGAALSGRLDGADPRVLPVAEYDQLSAQAQPSIVGCAQWNARDPSSPVTVLDKRPVKILVHHTATVNRDNVASADLEELARAIQNFHMDNNGWIDSGHHFLVNRGGLVAEGRHKSLASLLGGQKFIQGAHCPDQNETSIGIENQGSYTKVNPPVGMLVGLRALCAFACSRYGIEPAHLYGHRDFRDTACPGDKLYALLPWLRTQVGQLLGRGTEWRAVAEPTWPLVRTADQGPVVLAAQHLLRAAGMAGVPADGVFGSSTVDGVFAFQQQRGLEHTGMIGGGSWPLLAVDVRAGQGGDAEEAVHALLNRPEARAVAAPPVVDRLTWQRLLGTAGG